MQYLSDSNKIQNLMWTYYLFVKTKLTDSSLVQLVENPGMITTGGSFEHLSQANE